MACGKACCQKTADEQQTQAFLGLDSIVTTVTTINALIQLARTGLLIASVENDKLKELVSAIKALTTENQWLKKIVNGGDTPPAISVEEKQVSISFGPDANYTLIVPAAGAVERHALAEQFVAAANALQGVKKVTTQRLLPLFDVDAQL